MGRRRRVDIASRRLAIEYKREDRFGYNVEKDHLCGFQRSSGYCAPVAAAVVIVMGGVLIERRRRSALAFFSAPETPSSMLPVNAGATTFRRKKRSFTRSKTK